MPRVQALNTRKTKLPMSNRRRNNEDSTIVDWTKDHESRYNWLWGHWKKEHPNDDKKTFIKENHDPNVLGRFVENLNLSVGSKKNIIYMISTYLQKHNLNNSLYYQRLGAQYFDQIENRETQNVFDEKEMKHYRDRSYFLNIIDNLKGRYTEMDFDDHTNFLLLCLLTLQPPVRSMFYRTAYIVHNRSNFEFNHIFIDRRGNGKIFYMVMHDKVKHPQIEIEVEDPFLKQLILYSIKKFPREQLIQSSLDAYTDIANKTLLARLRKITKVSGITENMFRASYVNWFYREHQDYASRLKLANQMRHSIDAASKYYFKVDTGPKRPYAQQLQCCDENDHLKDQLEECNTKQVDTEAQFRKKKNDNIRRANNGLTKKISKKTMDKYGIKFDEEKQLYY